ncbi:MAG: class I SAM-dependent methyltransferase [Armatimonadetes bacterium]|nr:class I SAM-dependent methyltransferase [Armatimonadota bacterium]
MNPEEYTRMYELEDRYWWFVGRRTLALGLLRKYSHVATPKTLDLGCGTGVIFGKLKEVADPVGFDFSRLALQYCRKRGLEPIVQADAHHLPVQDNQFDAAICLDVYEHLKDDSQALRETFRALRPGGILVLSVPALMALWGPHDVALHHFRRYTRSLMASRLKAVGFEIERLSYSVFFLFPIVIFIRFLEKRRKGEAKASLPSVPDWMNRALIGLQAFEAKLIESVPLPWGSSVVAVARKPIVEEAK